MADGTASRARAVLRWVPAAVLGAALAACWARLFGGGMGAVFAWVMLISIGQLLGPLTLLVVAVHAIRRRRFSRPMALAGALALFSMWPALWGFGVLPMAFPAALATTAPSVAVRLPSDLPLRVAWGGDALATNRHAVAPDQRWAYDLVVEPAAHGSTRLEDYGIYGTPVLAPAAARVHDVVDGLPDETPGVTSNAGAPYGNRVVLELATGTFLVLAHLQPASLLVAEGDLVSEGQPLAACGNSGNTSEPHIHVHHQRQDPVRHPVNFAEGLPLFFRDHDGPPMPEGGVDLRDGKVVLTGAVVRHRPPR